MTPGTSDYGSDFSPDEEEILNALLHPIPEQDDNPNSDSNLVLKDIEDEQGHRGARVPYSHGQQSQAYPPLPISQTRDTVQLDSGNPRPAIESRESRLAREGSASIEAPLTPQPEIQDTRSPLERFRTKPKKALSVTDLISPSWCELQYWFTLTKHGKKRRTIAMKRGSAVHKVLEDQVHTTVAVDIVSKEDAWGLRVWNVIQGLKTLRHTGITRELEIWGVIDGLVVNGVIDELTYICPEPELEEAEEKLTISKSMPAADQMTITDFLGSSAPEGSGTGMLDKLRSSHKKISKIYIADVKTRDSRSLPKAATFRPTLMQLMLYHRILSDSATNKLNADMIFDRYELRADVLFSDSFIAQIGSLNVDNSLEQDVLSHLPSSQDSMTVLLAHNTLRQLWTLMMEEFAHTFADGAKSVGNVLKAEYRSRTDGVILGNKAFLYDDEVIQEYLDSGMRWWRGERAAEGVCVEEAYKCRTCDFFDECSWRRNKIEEATLKMRERKKSAV